MNSGQKISERERGIGFQVMRALWRWSRFNPLRLRFLLRIITQIIGAHRHRARGARRLGAPVPTVVAVSPTMRCNYDCRGCYSRGRSTAGELTTAELDILFADAEALGVAAFVVTGGEPLLRDDLLDLIARRRRLLFILITNGTHVTAETARRIAGSGNIIKLVSIEGFCGDTDERRQAGAHAAAETAMENLRAAGACFGFAAMNTTANTGHLGSGEFIGRMAALGCSIGLITEYVPCGPQPRPDWVLDDAARAAFRERVIALRRHAPVAIIQFPHDEYGPRNICSAAGRLSLHINSQGGVEPCPFIPVAVDSIRSGGLEAACRSQFMREIREQPALMQRRRLACSLFEHLGEIEVIASRLVSPAGESLPLSRSEQL